MNQIQVLDCTLRDGGYCNQWKFGKENILKIVSGLQDAGVQIIECGYLSGKWKETGDYSKFRTVREIDMLPGIKKGSALLVAMINYGEYREECLPLCSETVLDGIRVAFHKAYWKEALSFCRKVQEKGYMVFVQPMVSLNYTDGEFLELIHEVNRFEPYAFYIVDSFGSMNRQDLIRIFYLVDHNLSERTAIGYHAHNNMQLAFSNAQVLMERHIGREILVDSCVMGMGRGAGNLNTELLVEYLNDAGMGNYIISPLLNVIDEVVMPFYQKKPWGYSLPNYLSAKNNLHPNYATYLEEKSTLTVDSMNEIFQYMDEEKKNEFDREYIEELYLSHLSESENRQDKVSGFGKVIKGKTVLVIAPGKSSFVHKDKICRLLEKKDLVSIAVNHSYAAADTDYIFVSNQRRFRKLDKGMHRKCIVTSNIGAVDVYLRTSYRKLLNGHETVSDNSGLMLVRFLINLGAGEIWIAGMDGYSAVPEGNYAREQMEVHIQKEMIEKRNRGMHEVLMEYMKEIPVKFITETVLG